MGNELNNSGKLKEDTVLSVYVKEFLLNNNFTNDDKFKNYLKKRACCTNNQEVPISLPVYDTTTKEIYPMNLKVKVFPTAVTSNLCTIDDNLFYTTGTTGTTATPYKRDTNYKISDSCKNFYTDFCEKVYQNRSNYDTLTKKLYGPYEDNTTNTLNSKLKQHLVTNQFEDCNCMNSWYNKGIYENQSTNILTPDQMAQNFDNRCKTDINKKFISTFGTKTNPLLCINPTSLENTNLTDSNKISLNFSRNCPPTVAAVTPPTVAAVTPPTVAATPPTVAATPPTVVAVTPPTVAAGTLPTVPAGTLSVAAVTPPTVATGTLPSAIPSTLATPPTTLATPLATLATIPGTTPGTIPPTTLATPPTTLATPPTTLATPPTTLATPLTPPTTLATPPTTLATPPTTLATPSTTLATPSTTLATPPTTLATPPTTLATPLTTIQVIPSKIESISIKSGNTFVDLSWNAPSDRGININSYLIKKSTDLSNWVDISSTTTTSFKAINLLSNTKYYFKVQAKNINGFSPESNIVNITTSKNMLYIYIIGGFIILLVIVLIVFAMRKKDKPTNNDKGNGNEDEGNENEDEG
jgi:hypothetical protein